MIGVLALTSTGLVTCRIGLEKWELLESRNGHVKSLPSGGVRRNEWQRVENPVASEESCRRVSPYSTTREDNSHRLRVCK